MRLSVTQSVAEKIALCRRRYAKGIFSKEIHDNVNETANTRGKKCFNSVNVLVLCQIHVANLQKLEFPCLQLWTRHQPISIFTHSDSTVSSLHTFLILQLQFQSIILHRTTLRSFRLHCQRHQEMALQVSSEA